MSRRGKRHREEAPTSFFSFQDIIASVTGIMLLVTLLLSMELMTRTEGGQAQVPEVDVEGLAQRLQEAKARRERLQATLADLQGRLDKIVKGTTITREELAGLRTRIGALRQNNDATEGRVRKLLAEHDEMAGKIEQATKELKTKNLVY